MRGARAFDRGGGALGLPRPARRRAGESVVPMINVVFLLLIFFLMTAEIAPPPPLEVAPPAAEAPPAPGGEAALHVAADGRLAYRDARGEGVWPALADREGEAALPLRADAALPAAELARLLGRLAAAGVGEVDLAVVAR
ncbi:ExbD/TolR family protein [Rhodosalinus sediminis]|uniref:ExbD/TolR family protein n=1 Tax=Rhodosalinus sediminis TaxID=1940533 RepID=UPI002356145F|nr:biopolymer transporter ExbD [Rhodosalinus sediminis]